ncbi:hypothetical protein [Rhizobium sp. Leaf386]|uniref:hypothetical protein n=1 Tax=Rhizobium sp. Leaf386 TaxID=1736359 RepID=UPI000713742E|nr:hypothetical protein [Rhizobium sp. Leaf386]KQS89130.1 hypothetical protein ASG50_28045 [Rhizobium sp. Leaf386]
MPDITQRSPAARSFEQEQARQATIQSRSPLDGVLDDTFLASDPPAMTAPGIVTGGADIEAAETLNAQTGLVEESTSDAPAPLVDEALAANRLWKEQEEVNALRIEVARLQDAVVTGVPRVGRLAIEEIANKVRDRPLTVAAMIGAIAFLTGATR